MMMLLFEFLSSRGFFRYAFIWLIVRSSSLSDPFSVNKCFVQQFKILSAHVWRVNRSKYLLQVLQKFHKSTLESNSSDNANKPNEAEKKQNELNFFWWWKSIHWMKDAIHQSDYFNHPLLLFVAFWCSSLLLHRRRRPVVEWCVFFLLWYKPLKCFLKCAFGMILIQKNSNNVIPIDKNVFHEF